MKIIAQLQLQPDPEQAAALLETVERANAACDCISAVAWRERVFGKFALQQLCYGELKARFGLSAQMAIRALAKVGDAYKLDKRTERRFRAHGSIAYDDRILSYRPAKQTVSIWTLSGRQTIAFVAGAQQLALLAYRQGESDLVYRAGKWYLLATCDIPDPTPMEVDTYLGADLGIVNICVDSDGTVHRGAVVNGLRARHRRLRQRLQAKGTKSARRLLRHRRRTERRFGQDTNHVISKRLVAKAQGTGRGLALEHLTHLRTRITARKPHRATLSSWSFGQLRSFVAYKARRGGVPVAYVDPRNTSRTCPACGHVAKENRPNQHTFLCQSCGLGGLPDYFAAVEISRRASVNAPYVSDASTVLVAPGASPLPLGVGI
jgi:IS605 OrfB family transposase